MLIWKHLNTYYDIAGIARFFQCNFFLHVSPAFFDYWLLIDKDIKISADDFVQLFYLAYETIEGKKIHKIASKFMRYNSKTKGLK